MIRRIGLVWLALVGLLACRADDTQCEALAQHIVDLAEAEGKAGAATGVALERDCKTEPPTRKLVTCMMAATSLAELDAC